MALSRIFGRARMTYSGVTGQPSIDECCVNRTLMPRWRGPEVMEDESQAMGYVCHACGREFLPVSVQNRRLVRAGAAPAQHAEHTEEEASTEAEALAEPESAESDEAADTAESDEQQPS
jgi:predicted  nucleic acid-binding Zn-ribbon protein